GTEVIAHFNKNNEVVTGNGRTNQTLAVENVDTTPSLSKEVALQEAIVSVNAPQELTYEPTAELVVYPFQNKNYIAYKVNVNFMGEDPGNWFVYVDAKSGKVIDKFNGLMHAEE